MFSKRDLALFGIYISVFTNSLMFTVVFPMASKMITYFGLVENRTETGYWVGLLAGVLMIGRFLSSPIWGILCDKWGRRPVMLLGITTTSIFAILFGMSTNFIWALSFRFLQGLFSPITVVTRTLIGEMYSGKEQAAGMSYFTLIGNIGNISGNILGGFFEDPGNSGIFACQLFRTYPFLLPNFMIAVFGVISLVFCGVFLKETKKEISLLESEQPRGVVDLFKDPAVLQVTGIYCMCSFIGTAFSELIVLLLWADRDNGGFAFSPSEIGIVTGGTSFLLVLYIRKLFTKTVERNGLTGNIKNILQITIPVMIIYPLVSLSRYYQIMKFIILIGANLVCFTLDFMTITSTLIMLNNAVNAFERGKLNGVSMALGNLSRSISPPIFGVSFATTAKSGLPYPLNFGFSYILLSGFITIASLIARKLDKKLDHSKDHISEEKISEMVSISLSEETELD